MDSLTEMETFAEFVQARRKALGLSGVDLAIEAGLTKSEISAIENGRIKLPGADKRRNLAKALRISHVQLLVAAGELIALRWADVDFEEGRATISRTLTRNERRQFVIGTETKTHQTRTVAVPATTLAALKVWRTRQLELRLASSYWLDDDLVFTATYGYHLEPRTWRRVHQRLCQRAGVPDITLHGTRHSLATLMISDNTHPVVVQNILGHRSINTTLDLYSHPSAKLQEQAINSLADRLDRDQRDAK